MRVTGKSLQRSFIRGLNQNANRLTASQTRINTGQRFTKVSDNVSDATQALHVRTLLQRNETFLNNASEVQARLSAQENQLLYIHSSVQEAQELIMRGFSQTHSEIDRNTIATQIRGIRDAVIQSINAKTANHYTFASSANEPPIRIQGDLVLYHGQDVNNFAADSERTEFQVSMGPTLNIQQSALGVLGFGVDENNVANNLIHVLNQAAQAIQSDNQSLRGVLTTKMEEAQTSLLVRVSDVGMKARFMDSNIERLNSENLTLLTQQNKLEAVDVAEEIVLNKTHEMAWQINLQMGAKILPMSLFDFMR